MTPEEQRRLRFHRLLALLFASGVLHLADMAVKSRTGEYNPALLAAHAILDTVVVVWGLWILAATLRQRDAR